MSSVPSLGYIKDKVRDRDGLRSNRFAMASKHDTKISEFAPQSTIQRDGKARRELLTLFRKSPITCKRQSEQSLQDRQAALYCFFVVVMLQSEPSFLRTLFSKSVSLRHGMVTRGTNSVGISI